MTILLMLWGFISRGFSAATAFFTTKPGIYVGAALLILAGGWFYGHHKYNQGKADQIASEMAAGKKQAAQAVKIVTQIQTVYRDQAAQIVTVTKTLTKEVPIYVTKKDDAACTIGNGFVRLHDAAATGAVSSGGPSDDDTSSGIALSEVAATIAQNYGICRDTANTLKEWQDWYTQQKALWDRQ